MFTSSFDSGGTDDLRIQVAQISSLLQKALVSVQTIRNCFAPMNRLPPEILGHIFRDVRDSREDTYKTRCFGLRSQAPGPLDNVMLVCRHWRKIASTNPRLWSFVKVSLDRPLVRQDPGCKRIKYSHALNFLRSGDVPLAVELDMDRISTAFVEFHPRLRHIVRHAHRIQNLRLFISWKYSNQLRDLNYLMSPPCFPSLDVIQVTLYEASSFETDVAQPIHFFRHQYSPRVRTVFVHVYKGWLSGSLCTLQHLCIHEQSFTNTNLARFLQVLAENPRLEDLAISKVLHVGSEQWSPSQIHWDKVYMPNLKRLIIKGSDPSIYDVIHTALSLPLTTARQYSDPIGPWMRTLPTPADRLSLFQKTLVIVTGASAISVNGYLNKPIFVPQANLTRELSLGTYSKPTAADWMAFRHMEKVDTVIIRGSEFHKWIPFTLLKNSPMVFPALTEIRILAPAHSCGPLLLQFLQHRKRRGAGLVRLHILAARNNEDSVAIFKAWKRSCWKFLRVVPDVSFDLVENLSLVTLPDVCMDKSLAHTFWDPKLWEDVPKRY